MGVGIGPHLNEDEVERYSIGSVSEPELAPLEEHLLLCETCQIRVTETDVYVAAVKAAGESVWHEPARRRWEFLFFRLAPAAAAAALLIVLAVESPRLSNRAQMPAAVTLEALRGSAIGKAPAARPLIIRLDVTGLPQQKAYRLEAVDAAGNPVWKGEAAVEGLAAKASLPALGPGEYYLRIYEASGKLVREFGLETTIPGKAR